MMLEVSIAFLDLAMKLIRVYQCPSCLCTKSNSSEMIDHYKVDHGVASEELPVDVDKRVKDHNRLRKKKQRAKEAESKYLYFFSLISYRNRKEQENVLDDKDETQSNDIPLFWRLLANGEIQ